MRELSHKGGIYLKFNKKYVEIFAIIIFLAILLNYISIFDGGLLEHDKPYQHNANDMFTFSAGADVIKYQDDLTKNPLFLSAGFEDAYNPYPPVPGIISSELAQFTNLENYDFLIHINLIFLLFMMFIIYYMMRKIDVNLALFGLPLFLLMFRWPFNYTIHQARHWTIVSMLFMLVGLFCIYHLKDKRFIIPLALINAASFFTHARELQVGNMIFVVYLIIYFFKSKSYKSLSFNIQKLKDNPNLRIFFNYFISILITILLIFGWWKLLPSLFLSQGKAEIIRFILGDKRVTIGELGFLTLFVLLGIIFSIKFLFSKKNKDYIILYSFGIMMFLFTFVRLFASKTSQLRTLIPITYAPFLALGVWQLVNIIKKKLKPSRQLIFVALIFIILISFVAYNNKPETIPSQYFLPDNTWQAFHWIQENTPEESTILILYGDKNTQPVRNYLTYRPVRFVLHDNYIKNIQAGIISSDQDIYSNLGQGIYLLNNTTNQIYLRAKGPKELSLIESICNYQYVYIDHVSAIPIITSYNQLLISKLIEEASYQVVYSNEQTIILEGKNLSSNCFEDVQIQYTE